MLPDRCRVSVVQCGVRLHLSELRDTSLCNEWVDVRRRELEVESHDILPVFSPDVLDNAGIQVLNEVKSKFTLLFDDE